MRPRGKHVHSSETIDNDADSLVIVEHKGGDDLKEGNINVIVQNADGGNVNATWSFGSDSTLSVGETFDIKETTDTLTSGQTITVKVIHEPSNSVITSTQVEVQ